MEYTKDEYVVQGNLSVDIATVDKELIRRTATKLIIKQGWIILEVNNQSGMVIPKETVSGIYWVFTDE